MDLTRERMVLDDPNIPLTVMEEHMTRYRVVALASAGAQTRLRTARSVILKVGYGIVALGAFVLALELLKVSAAGLLPLFDRISANGATNFLGLGWVGAYGTLSGSATAATALGLLSSDVITKTEAMAMITGSRLGAAFIILFVGLLYYFRYRRTRADGLYIGSVALLTTIVIYTPAVMLGLVFLERGWLSEAGVSAPGGLLSITAGFSRAAGAISSAVPQLLGFAVGLIVLLLSFMLFDRVLPSADQASPRLERARRVLERPWMMFLAGALITCGTLSVAISLSLLVPLSMKGIIQRRNVIPYVMGANVTTLIDTLFAAIVLDTPVAVEVVLAQAIAVVVVSVVVLALVWGVFERSILRLADWAILGPRQYAVFVGGMIAVPVTLVLL